MTSDLALTERRQLGTTDLQVADLCLGGNVFGWTADESASFAVLDAYVAAGGNFIDTADAYSHWIPGNVGGESEAIIGNWMASRGNRDSMIIATKVAKLPTAAGLSPSNIRVATEDSLARLRTDHIDLYYAHEDDPTVPFEDSLGTFDALIAEGKVRYIAASNFTAPRLAEALAVSETNGLAAFVALQNHYNLMERSDYEQDLRPIVEQHGIASLPYYGLARGFLTGKYRQGLTVDSARAKGVAQYQNDRGDRVLAAVDACADRHGTTPAAVSLAWLLAQPTVTCALASARTLDQLDGLLAMSSVQLTPADLAELDAASA